MMNYEEFKKEVTDTFKEYLSDQYQDMTLQIMPVYKVNRMMDGLTLTFKSTGKNISPTIYVNDLYQQYIDTGNLKEVLEDAGRCMEMGFSMAPKVISLDFHNAKDNIVFQVVNTLQNEDMLKEMPHREFLDLSIIYRWVIAVDENGIQSTVIRNILSEQFGLDEEQLFRLAVENTRRIFPPVVKSINEVAREIYEDYLVSEDVVNKIILEIPEIEDMYVIGNNRGLNGAGSILYEDYLHELAIKLETDLYLFPSSVHECIAVPANLGDPYELAEMVNEINMSAVALEDRLSNQVYHYDKDLRKLTLATDTPNKKLDAVTL